MTLARAAALAALVLAAACDDGTGPHIAALEPTSGPRGQVVAVLGERFCGAGEGRVAADGSCVRTAGYVLFGIDDVMARASALSWTDTRISVLVPMAAPSGRVPVVVTVDGVSSNAVDFEVP